MGGGRWTGRGRGRRWHRRRDVSCIDLELSHRYDAIRPGQKERDERRTNGRYGAVALQHEWAHEIA